MQTIQISNDSFLDGWESKRKSLSSMEFELQYNYPIRVITTQKDYKLGMEFLEYLMDNKENKKGADLKAINEYMKGLIRILDDYESVKYSDIYNEVTFERLVKDLLEVNDLDRKSLEPIFGDKGMVSRYLNGKIKLNEDHIRKLCKLLKCSSDFILGTGLNKDAACLIQK
jgi:antitoxin component HigA of HigAB toxin-antitoxin module